MKVIVKGLLMVVAFILTLYGLICFVGMRSGYEIGLVVQMVVSFGLAVLCIMGAVKNNFKNFSKKY